MIANYVCASGAPSPLEWRRCKKQDAGDKGACKDHTQLCLELSDDALRRGLPGAFPFASSFTSAKGLHHLHRNQRASVGALKLTRQVVYAGREPKLPDVARQIPGSAKKPVRVGSRRSWYLSQRLRMPDVPHPVRIVVFGKERDEGEAREALVRNQLVWEVLRMLWVYRHRWTGTETFHRDGKQQWGLGDWQGRSGEGQTRHVSLVSAASSRLRRSRHQNRPQDGARRTLTPIGDACRAVKAATLEQVVDWIVAKLTVDHGSVSEMKAVLVHS